MTTELTLSSEQETILSSILLTGDISKLDAKQRWQYVKALCSQLQLNPHTQPFMILKQGSRETLYATKAAAEQLGKVHKLSFTTKESSLHKDAGVYKQVCTATANNRSVDALAAVSIANLSGEALCNAIMRCDTKAMRRATLRWCGLGVLDELEVATIPNVTTTVVEVTEETVPALPEVEKVPEPSEEDWKHLHEEAKKNNYPDGYVIQFVGKRRTHLPPLEAYHECWKKLGVPNSNAIENNG